MRHILQMSVKLGSSLANAHHLNLRSLVLPPLFTGLETALKQPPPSLVEIITLEQRNELSATVSSALIASRKVHPLLPLILCAVLLG